MRALSILLLITVALPASVNYSEIIVGGTTAACIVGDSYVVCAADSRESDERKAISDKGCKMIAMKATTLFLTTGVSELAITDNGSKLDQYFNSLETARRVYRLAAESIDSVADTWGETTRNWFNHHSGNLKTLSFKSGGLVVGAFIGFTSNRSPYIKGYLIKVDETTGKAVALPFNTVIGNAGQIVSFGTNQDAAHMYADRRTNGRNLERDVATVNGAVKFVINSAAGPDKETVGGQIETAILRSNGDGIEWRNRKKGCYAKDLKEDLNSPN